MGVGIDGEFFSAVALDFDGVVLDSAGIKLDAFETVLPDDPRVRAYLGENEGRPRHEKFKYVWEWILNAEYTPEIAQGLDRRFSDLVDTKMASARLIQGVDRFIRDVSGQCYLAIVSAAPETDVRRLLDLHGMIRYFDEVHGGVADKADVLQQIIGRAGITASEIIFFGDTEADRLAAIRAGVAFVGVQSDFTRDGFVGAFRTIADFTDL